MRVLVTGATGFVGRSLCRRLMNHHVVYRGICRVGEDMPPRILSLQDAAGELSEPLQIDAVVHLAARVHVMGDQAADPEAEFRAANVDLTLALAEWAAACGAKRFIFMSSAKVNGEATLPGCAFTEDNTPSPEDGYALSKLEAELGLRKVCLDTGMEFVVIRPPLVYGPGVKGNFGSMVRWIKRGVPLPLGAVQNRRSLVALDNLVDFVVTCLEHPAAANEVFLVSDGEDVSTTDMLRRIAGAYGVPARLLPVSRKLLSCGARLLGKGAVADRLLGSLMVSDAKARALLGWCPAVTMDEQLRKMALDDACS